MSAGKFIETLHETIAGCSDAFRQFPYLASQNEDAVTAVDLPHLSDAVFSHAPAAGGKGGYTIHRNRHCQRFFVYSLAG